MNTFFNCFFFQKLQNFMYEMLNDSNNLAAKLSLVKQLVTIGLIIDNRVGLCILYLVYLLLKFGHLELYLTKHVE